METISSSPYFYFERNPFRFGKEFILVMRGDESVANMNIFRRFFFTRKEKKNRREKQENDYLLKFSFQ